MYKIIYAHDVHKANLLGNAQLLYRKEREKRERKKEKKLSPPSNTPLLLVAPQKI